VSNSVRRLHAAQGEIFNDPARFRFACCGAGFGKTHVAVASILRAVSADPRAREHGATYLVLYVAPTRDMARDIVWEWLLDETPAAFIRKTNHTRLEIQLTWGPKIKLMGADKLRRARGLSVNFLVVDEFAHMRDGIWAVLRPRLRTPADRALIITTPNGPNFAFSLWQAVQGLKDWKTWRKPSWENPYHDPSILEEAKHTLSQLDYDQEYGASFAALRGAIYSDFTTDRNVPPAPMTLNPQQEIYVGQDYNGGLYSAVIGQRRGKDSLDIVDEVVTTSNIYAHVDALKGYLVGKGVDPGEIGTRVTVCSDASGEYNHTSKTDNSDNRIMRAAGFRVKPDPRNPPVLERVKAVQGMVRNAAGEVRLRVSPTARELQRCMLNQTWNAWGKPDKAKGLDHLPDALGYMVCTLFPVARKSYAEAR
jgi:hypothetical protein